MAQLVTFGEAMVRLSPPGPMVIEQASHLDMFPASSELNAAVTAQRLGLSTRFVSRFAADPLGRFLVNKTREHGIDTAFVQWSEEHRQGLYFYENGVPPRPGMAYYDRGHSAFSYVQPGEFAWNAAFKGAAVFHTSGINPALNDTVHRATLEAVQTAKDLGLKVSFDFNYRSKLWEKPKAAEVLQQYMPYVDILFTSAGDAETILGLRHLDGEELAQRIAKDYAVPTVCLVHRSPNPESLWRVTSLSHGTLYHADQRGTMRAVERLGAGDALAGGFLTGFLEEGPQLAVQIANASMTLKNTYQGDFSYITREAVDSHLAGDFSMVKR